LFKATSRRWAFRVFIILSCAACALTKRYASYFPGNPLNCPHLVHIPPRVILSGWAYSHQCWVSPGLLPHNPALNLTHNSGGVLFSCHSLFSRCCGPVSSALAAKELPIESHPRTYRSSPVLHQHAPGVFRIGHIRCRLRLVH